MGSVRIKIDESLQQCFERIRLEIAMDVKKKYNLDTITIHGTAISKLLAAKLNNKNYLNYEIEKIGLNKGIIRFL